MNETSEIAPPTAFQSKISDCRVKIDSAIFAELNQRRDSMFFKPLMNALKGGKRLRPILLLLSFESVGKQRMDPFPAAVAVELAHTESLIHDDIIDRDHLRRETATFHTLYGNETALLSADFILSVILGITAKYSDPRVAHALSLATAEMCEGELEELVAYRDKQTLGKDEYVNIVSKKTASLFEASTTIGAVISEAREDEITALSEYGRLLGIAYQIQDDIADLKKATANNILKLLDGDSGRIRSYEKMSKSYALEAIEKLKTLRIRNARSLVEMADFITSQATTGI